MLVYSIIDSFIVDFMDAILFYQALTLSYPKDLESERIFEDFLKETRCRLSGSKNYGTMVSNIQHILGTLENPLFQKNLMSRIVKESSSQN